MKVALITGASSGIGKEFARQLDDENLDEIWVVARRKDLLEELKGILKTKVIIFPLDLLLKDSLDEIEKYLQIRKAEIVYLVNAAGFGKFGTSKMDLKEVNDMIDLNVKALVNITYICIPYMKEGGHIIEISSTSSFTPLVNFNIYASTKAFIMHFANGLYKELKREKIKVISVCPGWTKTEFFKNAGANMTKNSPKIIRPLYDSKYVVKKAIRDSKRDRIISLPGGFTKMHYILSRLLPKRVMMDIWDRIQK